MRPELTAAALTEWAERHGMILDFIQPDKPMQNGFIERFNKTLRTEILDMYLFRTLSEVRGLTEDWRTEYLSTTLPNDRFSTFILSGFHHF